MRHKRVRLVLFVLNVFGALTAIAGGIGLLTGGISLPPDLLQGTPFADYTLPGLALLIVVGGSFLFAAATILTGREISALASAFAGLAVMGFEVVEVAVIDRSGGSWLLLAVALQAFYLLLGLACFGLAASLWMTEFRGHHFPTRHVSHA